MLFDWTITLGNLVTALAIVAGTWAAIARLYGLLDKRLTLFEQVLNGHAATLTTHAARLEKQDDLMLQLSGDMQRILGRLETWANSPKVGNQ